jgi:flagellar motor switch protein FliM
VRFGDYINSIPLPTILAVFRAEEWDNFGLITVDSTLAYSVIDVLLGGRRASSTARLDGRPYSSIETSLVRRMLDLVLVDTEYAFKPLSPVHFNIDRIETNPRFASISRPANAAILVQLRIDMEGRGGSIEILLPYATIEPIRELLLQSFMGEKFGRDPIWEDHLATEIWQAHADLDAILYEAKLPLRRMLELKVGDTLMFDAEPESPVRIKCGDVLVTEGRMGRMGDKIAIRVSRPLRRSKTTFAAYEASATAKRDGK